MPGKRSAAQPTSVHQLKVTLLGIKPAIWRQIAVPSDFTLGDLHHVIQITMGWDDSHMHDFRIGKAVYSDPRMLVGEEDRDEGTVTLTQVLPRVRTKVRYTYDFGDNWEHELQVEKIGAPEPDGRYPLCLAGERACPPEDCGGIWQYEYLLDVLSDPEHPDRDEMEEQLEWLGPIDPEAFDVKKANAQLKKSLKYVWTR